MPGDTWLACNTLPSGAPRSTQPCWGVEGCHWPRARNLKWLLFSGASKAELANLLMEAQLMPVKDVCQDSWNQVLNWEKSDTSKRSFSSWPAQLRKGLVLHQPQCCSHCTSTELRPVGPALTPDTQCLWPTLAFAHTETCQAVALPQGQPHWFTRAKHPSPWDLENLSCHHVCAT